MSARAPALEAKLLAIIERQVERQVGITADGFSAAVRHRLSVGEGEFGDAFLTRSNTGEAREEVQDAGAYVLLELQRLERDGRLTDGIRDDLLRAAVFAAAADACLRRVARALRQRRHER